MTSWGVNYSATLIPPFRGDGVCLYKMCLFSIETSCNCSDYFYNSDQYGYPMGESTGRSVSQTGNFGKRYRRTTRFRLLAESSALSTAICQIPESCEADHRLETCPTSTIDHADSDRISDSRKSCLNSSLSNGKDESSCAITDQSEEKQCTESTIPSLARLNLRGSTNAQTNWIRVVEKATPTKPDRTGSLCKSPCCLGIFRQEVY